MAQAGTTQLPTLQRQISDHMWDAGRAPKLAQSTSALEADVIRSNLPGPHTGGFCSNLLSEEVATQEEVNLQQ